MSQSALSHLVDAQFAGASKTVLDAAQDAVQVVLVALKLQHRVHDMFQHLGSCQRPLLVDVADENGAHPSVLGILEQAGRTLPYLSEAAGRGFHGLCLDGLYGVDDHQVGACFLYAVEDFLQAGFAQDKQFVFRGAARQSFGSELYLPCTLFSAHIQDSFPLEPEHGLQYQCAFAYARFAA